MGETTIKNKKELKVENWGVYLLQRFYNFYVNTMHCDVKLRFPATSEIVQVHRLVLCACGDYFDSDKLIKDPVLGDIYDLECNMQPDAVLPIISFLYTGKMEFDVQHKARIYDAAVALRVDILVNLLRTPLNDLQDLGAGDGYAVASNQASEVRPAQKSSPSSFLAEMKPQMKPAASLSAEVKSQLKNVSSNILPSTSHKGKNSIEFIKQKPQAPKRLPIWTKPPRLLHMGNVDPILLMKDDGKVRVVLSDPVPTRFSIDEELPDNLATSNVNEAFRHLCHDSGIPLKHPFTLGDGEEGCSAPKKIRTDINEMREHGKQQLIRNELISGEDEDGCDLEPDSLPADRLSADHLAADPQPLVASVPPPKPILKKGDSSEPSKRVRFSEVAKTENSCKPTEKEEPPIPDVSVASTSAAHLISSPSTAVKVERLVPKAETLRVSLAPTTATSHTGELIVNERDNFERRVRFSVVAADGSSVPLDSPGLQGVGNPAKIVSEMIKKYPDLVSGRKKSVKLKVLTGGNPADASNPKGSVAYIVVHAPEEDDQISPVTRNEWNPENTTGPWTCTPCGDVKGHLRFENYESFRTHLTLVHQLRINPAICEKCGMKTHKKNQLMYHMLTKHDVQPPPSFVFPKCSECDYVAYTKVLLAKHEEIHSMKQSLTCFTCNATFKSAFLMNSHLRSDWHERMEKAEENDLCLYPCPFCDRGFEMALTLKCHVEANHQVITLPPPVLEPQQPMEEETSIENPGGSSETQSDGSHEGEIITLAQHEPSSELEALHHVATGISTSLLLADSVEEEYRRETTIQSTNENGPEYAQQCYKEEPESETFHVESEKTEIDSYNDTQQTIDDADVSEQHKEYDGVYKQIEMAEFPPDQKGHVSYQTEEEGHDGGIAYDDVGVAEQEVGVGSGEAVSEGEISETDMTLVNQNHTETQQQERDLPKEGVNGSCVQGDHDYAPYNPVVMFQPNVVLPQRVILTQGNMLVTHPIQVLPSTRILITSQNLITDQLVSYPYPQVTQVVENSQSIPIAEPERKAEPVAFVSEWDENSQSEALVEPVVRPGVGPSRPDFF